MLATTLFPLTLQEITPPPPNERHEQSQIFYLSMVYSGDQVFFKQLKSPRICGSMHKSGILSTSNNDNSSGFQKHRDIESAPMF